VEGKIFEERAESVHMFSKVKTWEVEERADNIICTHLSSKANLKNQGVDGKISL
jgi:hypothetical protein